MSLFEIIKSICAERGISVYRIEKDCGFGNGSLMKWEKSSPKVENLIKLADYFGVSLDYLVGRNIQKQEISIETLSMPKELLNLSRDKNFIDSAKLYNAVSHEYKKQICAYILGVATALGVNIAQVLGK